MLACKIEPLNAAIYNNLGTAYLEEGISKKAEENFRYSAVLEPTEPRTYWNLHSYSQTIEEAVRLLQFATLIDHTYKKATFTLSYFNSILDPNCNTFSSLQKRFPRHHYITSIKWLENINPRPTLIFNRWEFFDHILEKNLNPKKSF